MTIATLILTCTIFVALGWTGDAYSPVALCVGAVVCIAAANAGATSQDLKTGYIVGATPLYQQIGLIIGVLASALVIGVTTLYLHSVMTIGSRRAAGAAGDADVARSSRGSSARTCRGAWCWSACSSRSRSSCAASTRCRSRSARTCRSPRPRRSSPAAWCAGTSRRKTGVAEESEVGSGTLFSSGLIAGGSLAGILYAVLFGNGIIADAESVTAGADPLDPRRDGRHGRRRPAVRRARQSCSPAWDSASWPERRMRRCAMPAPSRRSDPRRAVIAVVVCAQRPGRRLRARPRASPRRWKRRSPPRCSSTARQIAVRAAAAGSRA